MTSQTSSSTASSPLEAVHLFTTGFLNTHYEETNNNSSNSSTYTWGAFQSEYLNRLNKNTNNGFNIRNNPYSMLISKPFFEIVTTGSSQPTGSTTGSSNTLKKSNNLSVGHNEISTLVAASPKSPLSRVALDLLSPPSDNHDNSSSNGNNSDDAIVNEGSSSSSSNNSGAILTSPPTTTTTSVLFDNTAKHTDTDNTGNNPSVDYTYLGSRLQSAHFRNIAASGNTVLLLHSSGDIYQWTIPTLKQQQQQQQQMNLPILPHLVQSLTWERVLRNFTITTIACGPNHCLALTSAPYFDVYSWGNGENGRLGHGNNTGNNNGSSVVVRHESNPRLISALIPYRVTSIAAGTAHNAAVTMGSVGLYTIEQTELSYLSGKQLLSGTNNPNDSGNGTVDISSSSSSNTTVINIHELSSEGQQQLAINILNRNRNNHKSNNNHDQNLGNVWTWGKGTDGALGHGNTEDVYEPKRVHGIVRVNHRILSITNSNSNSSNFGSSRELSSASFSIRDDISETSSVDTGTYQDSARRNTVNNANRIRLGGNPSSNNNNSSTNGKNISSGSNNSSQETYETYRLGIPTTGISNSSSFHYPLRRNVTANATYDSLVKNNQPQRNERAIVVSLSCGNQTTGVITTDGDVWIWGRGKEGQMGLDLKHLAKMASTATPNGVVPSITDNSLLRPHRLTFPPMQYHLDTDSVCRAATKIYNNMDSFTKLLACPWTLQTSPVEIKNESIAKDTEESEQIEVLTTPQLASFGTKATVDDGSKKLWTIDPFYWATGNERIPTDSTPSAHYENLSIPDTLKVATIAAGDSHFVIGGRDGSVWSWGLNIDGQVGMGRLNSEIHRPTQLPVHLYAQAHAESFVITHQLDSNELMMNAGSDPIISVHAGAFHSVVLSYSGLLMTWGRNNNHQLGVDSNSSACQPETIQLNNASKKLQSNVTGKEYNFGTSGLNVVAIACGNEFTSVLGNFSIPEVTKLGTTIQHTTSFQTLSSANTENIDEEPTLAPPQESSTSEEGFALKTPRKKNSMSGISRTSSLSSTGSQNVVASFDDVIRSPNLRRGLSMAYGGNNNRNLKIQRPPSIRIQGVSTVPTAVTIVSEAVVANLLRTAELKSSRRLVDEMRKQGLVDEWNTALQTMSGNWNAFMMTDVRLHSLWRQGLPPQLRCYVWPLAVGNSLKITPAMFDMCRIKAATVLSHLHARSPRDPQISSASSSSETENYAPHSATEANSTIIPSVSLVGRESSIGLINMDLLRTFSQLELFGPPDSHSAGPFYECVLDVLQAFCCLRPELGYVQGMSYIAAIIALHVAGTAVWATRNSNESISVGQRSAPSSSAKENISLSLSPTPMKRYQATIGAYGGVLSSPIGSPTPGLNTPFPIAFPPTATPYSRSLSALSPVIPSQVSGWKVVASLLPVLPISPGFSSPDPKSLQTFSLSSPVAANQRTPDHHITSPIDLSNVDSTRTPAVNRHRNQESTGKKRSTVSKLSSNLVVGDATFLTFQIFSNLLCRHHLYVFFTMDAAALTPYCTLFETLVDLRQPEVFRKLDSSGIRTEMYLFGWFQTLFLKSLPLAVAVRVWDVFLLDGVVHLYRTALALIDLLSSHILVPNAGFEEVVNLLTQGRTATAVWSVITDPDVLFRAIDNVIIPNELVIQIEDLCNDPFFYRFVAER